MKILNVAGRLALAAGEGAVDVEQDRGISVEDPGA
jgi:hypothetical protein